ncbi:GntR family transcriptional regulator [Cryptosporangium sp. NPDC048952]|uniref:GntR family transcriptional regulator n=1 Tax=Cryptosporangium sp. NPDC048952 TaxID=3363961 RepID=UPI00371C5180
MAPDARPAGGSGFQTLARQTMGDRVYVQVRDAILRGEIAAGSEINQVELATRFGVSRVPVREALRRLQAERFLDANPFQRFVVTKLTDDQVLELFNLRAELEVFAALQSRRRPGHEATLKAARRAAAELDLAMPGDEWIQADMEFHRTLNGREAAVTTIIDEVRFRIYRYLHLEQPDLDRRRDVLTEHEAILQAYESGDEAEIRAMIGAHVQHTRDRLAATALAGQTVRPA